MRPKSTNMFKNSSKNSPTRSEVDANVSYVLTEIKKNKIPMSNEVLKHAIKDSDMTFSNREDKKKSFGFNNYFKENEQYHTESNPYSCLYNTTNSSPNNKKYELDSEACNGEEDTIVTHDNIKNSGLEQYDPIDTIKGYEMWGKYSAKGKSKDLEADKKTKKASYNYNKDKEIYNKPKNYKQKSPTDRHRRSISEFRTFGNPKTLNSSKNSPAYHVNKNKLDNSYQTFKSKNRRVNSSTFDESSYNHNLAQAISNETNFLKERMKGDMHKFRKRLQGR